MLSVSQLSYLIWEEANLASTAVSKIPQQYTEIRNFIYLTYLYEYVYNVDRRSVMSTATFIAGLLNGLDHATSALDKDTNALGDVEIHAIQHEYFSSEPNKPYKNIFDFNSFNRRQAAELCQAVLFFCLNYS